MLRAPRNVNGNHGCPRYTEFGHAVLDRLLDTTIRRPPMYYVGVLRDDQRDCAAAMEGNFPVKWKWVSESTADFSRRWNHSHSGLDRSLSVLSSSTKAFPGDSG